MTTAIENFDEMVVKHCDDRGTELAKTGVMEHCAHKRMEHCDDNGHGALC